MAANHLLKVLFGFLATLFLAACSAQEPVSVGFAGVLTGPQADLGVAGRDGVVLAVEQINEQGGINGRPVELIIKDDQGDPETARKADAELAEAGATAIIGHMTSGQVAAVLDQINKDQIVMIGPTVTSDRFTGKADYFFRNQITTNQMGTALAEHMFNSRNIRNVAGIYDLGNQAYTEDLWQAFQNRFTELGGNADQSYTFTSGQTDLQELMANINATQPKSVVFVASAIDTALMAQYGRQSGSELPYFGTTWAHTNELLNKGGQAIEGIELVSFYDPENPFPASKRFITQFENRYKRPPTFPAAFSYEAVLVLAEALTQTNGEKKGLPEAITNIKALEGVQGVISIDQFGDVTRDVYITAVKNGYFETINTISPATNTNNQ